MSTIAFGDGVVAPATAASAIGRSAASGRCRRLGPAVMRPAASAAKVASDTSPACARQVCEI